MELKEKGLRLKLPLAHNHFIHQKGGKTAKILCSKDCLVLILLLLLITL